MASLNSQNPPWESKLPIDLSCSFNESKKKGSGKTCYGPNVNRTRKDLTRSALTLQFRRQQRMQIDVLMVEWKNNYRRLPSDFLYIFFSI